MNNLKKAAVSSAIAFGVATPFLPMASASASTTDSGCTVSADRPIYSGINDASNRPLVDYKLTVTCEAGVTIETDERQMEQDLVSREGEGVDDQTGKWSHTWDFTGGADTKSLKLRRALPTTPNDGPAEEMYQKFRFRVTSGPVTSPWTSFELTDVRSIYH